MACIVCNQATGSSDGTFWNDSTQDEDGKVTVRTRLEHVLGKTVESKGWLCQRCQDDLTQIEVLLANFRKRYWKTFHQKRDPNLKDYTNPENLCSNSLLSLVPVLGGTGEYMAQPLGVNPSVPGKQHSGAEPAAANVTNPAFISEIKSIISDSRVALRRLERTPPVDPPSAATYRKANVEHVKLFEARSLQLKKESCDLEATNSEYAARQHCEKDPGVRQETKNEHQRPRPEFHRPTPVERTVQNILPIPEKANPNSPSNTAFPGHMDNPICLPEDDTLSISSTHSVSLSQSPVLEDCTKPCSVNLGDRVCVCDICNRPFSGKRDLKQHMAVHTRPKVFTCKVCDCSFAGKDRYKDHMQIQHKVAVIGMDDLYKEILMKENSGEFCTSSLKSYKLSSIRSKTSYKVTHRSMEGNYICDICKEVFPSPSHVVRHIQVHKMKK